MHRLKYILSGFFALGLMATGFASQPVTAQASNAADKTVYNKAVSKTKTLYHTKYGFYKKLYKSGMKRSASAKYDYKHHFKVTRMAKNGHGVFYKTNRGWIRQDAFYKWVRYANKMDYTMKVNKQHILLYNKPKGLKGAKVTGSTSTKQLVGKWVHVDKRVELNTTPSKSGYYRMNVGDKNYWIRAKYLTMDQKALKGNIKKVEKAIKTGSALVGKSKYLWGGGRTSSSIAARRFDCSSFIHWIYAKSGVRLGPTSSCTTYTLIHMGRKIKAKNMKRGDIFFFTDKSEGVNCHVAIYLGNQVFLHDSPSSDTGGVGISSLNDSHWKSRFNGNVRRLVG
ncbi:C40 family peptidase [Levilactobacillus yiduensis]|uniref:C40 family peptidase n=1 Tax=Levilactobacillus yiduensis TaxID=2953880 RepID=UPI001AD8477F|nr:NlpC/P60 family protein [Levilactobacillus yiduensis]